jgi:FKBP-type peptidyl-prolyl cis-trans isomerase FklB
MRLFALQLFIKSSLMKKVLLSSLFFLAAAVSVSAQKNTKAKPASKPVATKVNTAPTRDFRNLLDSFSYAAGYNVATNMQAQGITTVNTALMLQGLEDGFKKKQAIMNADQLNSCMQNQLNVFNAAKDEAEKGKGQAFLDSNKKRKEVITLPSGLQYEVLKSGDINSASPKVIDTVVVHYVGKLIDGTEFDNSLKRNEPAAFPVNGVIKGWIEILQLMHINDHWKVYIPSELAYGTAGAGGAIPPNAVLVFDIILEDIRPAKNANN